jgi:hypothetical protein
MEPMLNRVYPSKAPAPSTQASLDGFSQLSESYLRDRKLNIFMKTPILKGFLLLGLGCLVGSASAEVPVINAQASVAVEAPRLPYGVADVVKLSRAQVSEEIIVSYIQNSGTVYSLEPKDILYLKDQGV